MKAVSENPYRILGLSCGASERDIAKRVSELHVFLDMGKSRSYENDFTGVWKLSRTSETVRTAASKLENSADRERHSIFWFWESTPIDSLAMETLRRGEPGQALKLWEKTLTGSNSQRSPSHARNLSILHLGLMMKPGAFGLRHCTASLANAAAYFSSPEAIRITPNGVAMQTPSNRLAQYFVDEFLYAVKDQVGKPSGPAKREMVALLSAFPSDISNRATNDLLSEPLQVIREAFENGSAKRQRSPLDGCRTGAELLGITKPALLDIATTLGYDDPRYTVPADKVANEVLQCSIDHYNAAEPQQLRPMIDQAVDLADSAELLAASSQFQSRARETASIFRQEQTRLTGVPARPNVRALISGVAARIDDLPDTETLSSVQRVVLPQLLNGYLNVIRPPLKTVYGALGARNADYLRISSAAADAVLDRLPALLEQIDGAHQIALLLDRIGSMHLLPATRDRIDPLRVTAARSRVSTTGAGKRSTRHSRQNLRAPLIERAKQLLMRAIGNH